MAAQAARPTDDPALSLALAMVVASTAPLLLLDGDMTVLMASASFCRAFDIDPAEATGRRLFDLGAGEWSAPQLRSLMNATASGDAAIDAYEMDLLRPGQGPRRLVINVQRLAYGSADQLRLLVSVTDITEARRNEREAEDLARQNAMLIQEVRHRVANSLQIIASVMMQNARRTQSEETRGQLRDAHKRVMSIADLQQQLAASTQGTVRLRTYLEKLCETISASMIADPAALLLEVTAQDVVIDAGVSVSMGLMVTELVINSLKHAFPQGQSGRIVVDYQEADGGWTLSVADSGVGMPAEPIHTTGGLGSSIIQALARQLHARVEVTARHPGTQVSIVCKADGIDAARQAASEVAV